MAGKDWQAQLEVVKARMEARKKEANYSLKNAITKACLVVERQAKQDMTNTSTSPSSPGEPPAVDTGRLRASVTHVVEGGGFKAIKGFVGTNVVYGRYLEVGTSKIAPRPWLTPALEKNRDLIMAIVKDATSKGIRGEVVDMEGGED